MIDILVPIKLFILGFITLISFIVQFQVRGGEFFHFNYVWIISGSLFLLLGAWFFSYLQLEPVVEKVETFTVSIIQNNAIIANGEEIINVNKLLGCNFKSGDKIEKTSYKGWYWTKVGIYCTDEKQPHYTIK